MQKESEGKMSDENNLVSVIIPTKNSGATIKVCLDSVMKQTCSNIEVIVVDAYSSDNTREISRSFGAKILKTKEKRLAARYTGLKKSKGKYILLLDSDQILEKTAITRAVKKVNNFWMICLEECVYKPKTWVQKLFEADKYLIHKFAETHLQYEVLSARFYRREILEEAFKMIPKELMHIVAAYDDSIIHYEAYKLSKKVAVLPKAVWHIEISTLIELLKRNYMYGKTAKELLQTGHYQEFKKRVRFRKGALKIGNLKYGIQSCLLLILRGMAYQVGYWIQR